MPQHLLIVSESEPLSVLIRRRLEGEPIELAVAHGVVAARQQVQQGPVDVVLLDADLPDSAAPRFCRLLRTDPLTEHLPVIVLAGASAGDQKSAALEAGATDVLAKPIDPVELRARVRAALRLKFLTDLLATRGQLDPATGLWNHRYFDTRLVEEIALARRAGRPLSCVVLKLTNIPEIGRRHGRLAAEQAVASLVGVIQQDIRTEDIACRTAADEISLILPNTPIGGALAQADRLHRALVRHPLQCHGESSAVGVTVGAAQWTDTDARKLHTIARGTIYAMPPAAMHKARADSPTPQQRVA